MADNRTMAQMLQAPIEGYEDAIVVPPINANNFELKQPLINLVQSNKFQTDGEARDWLDNENSRSILTWEDIASTSNSGNLPSQTVTNPRQQINTITTRSGKTLEEPSSSPVKTSDNIEKFTDELAPLDSLPENNKDVEIKSSSSSTLTSPEASELEDYLEKDSIPPGIDLTLPTTLEVLSSNPTFPTLTKEKVCSWKTPMFLSLVRFVWKMMTRIAIRKKIMCILATYLHKKPKPLSQEVEEIKENEKEVSSDVPIDTIVMPIRITFDNPIDFNDHFSKPKDLKKDLPISFDSTTTRREKRWRAEMKMKKDLEKMAMSSSLGSSDHMVDENVGLTPSNFIDNSNKVDVVVPVESIRAIIERFANTAYGFFLGKRVAYPVVANYVRNTLGKYGLVKSMLNSSTEIFSFQFSSTEGLDAMLENGLWFIRKNSLILKKWNPDVNLLKEDVGNVPVWVKLHGVPMTAFSKDGLSAIATKIGTPLVLDSYTSDMCIRSWDRSSYARALIKFWADVDLKDNIMVFMPKLIREGFYTCNVHAEYEWKPPRCTCCKYFGHVQDECPKNKVSDVVSQKNNVSTNGNKKKDVEPTKEVSKSNLFDVLNLVENDVDLGINGGTSNLTNKKANSSESSFWNAESSSTSTTPIVEKIDRMKRLIIDGMATLVDDAGIPLKWVDSSSDHDSDDKVSSVDNDMANFLASKDSKGEIILNVASSGLASLLLDGGRTTHSRYAIPINIVKDSMRSISADGDLAELIRETKIIIWDEALMITRLTYEPFDRTLRDICTSTYTVNSDEVFGGKLVVFGGNFRQILHVIPNGSRQDIVHASLNISYLWQHCIVLNLTKNMRLHVEGKIGGKNDGHAEVEFPEEMLIPDYNDHIEYLIRETYYNWHHNIWDATYFQDRVILAPIHKQGVKINERILAKLPGREKVCYSSDSVSDINIDFNFSESLYTAEF
ncbi:ATP-dependent DNA helicase PIF1-like protein [Tanacetum coccineum]